MIYMLLALLVALAFVLVSNAALWLMNQPSDACVVFGCVLLFLNIWWTALAARRIFRKHIKRIREKICEILDDDDYPHAG